MQCSYEQETDKFSNLCRLTSTMSVLDSLNYGMALEDSGSRTAMWKILIQFRGLALEFGWKSSGDVDNALQAEYWVLI